MKCLAILAALAVSVLVTPRTHAQWGACSSGQAAAFSNAFTQSTTTTTTTFSDDGGYEPYFGGGGWGGGYYSGGFRSLPWFGGSQFFAPPARTLPIWWPNFYGYGRSFNFVPRSSFGVGGFAYGGFNRGFSRGFGAPLVIQSGRFNRIGPGGLNRFGPNATIVQSGRRNRIR